MAQHKASYNQAGYVAQTVAAVYTYANGLRNAHMDLCKSKVSCYSQIPKFLKIQVEMVWVDLLQLLYLKTLWSGTREIVIASLADPTPSILSHCDVIVLF